MASQRTLLSALALVAALVAAPAAEPAPVLVFNSTRYVDANQGSGYPAGSQESENIQAALAALGHTVSTIAGADDPTGSCAFGQAQPGTVLATAAAYQAALATTHVFVVPEQESYCYLPAELPADVIAVWRQWVADGGGLIVVSSNEARIKVDDLFFVLFGFRAGTVNGNGVTTTRTAAAEATRFAGAAPSLPGNDSTGLLRLAGLPPGSVSVYDDGTNSSVAIIPFGLGKIVHLGWDWTASSPPFTPGLNGGWYPTVLDGAVREAGSKRLTVQRAGDGVGTLASHPPGIACGADCGAWFETGTVVQLTATAAAGSVFQGWSGDPDCADGSVTLGGNRACTATFAPQGTPPPPPPGGGRALLVTGPGPGGGPDVRIFRGTGEALAGAMAGAPSFRGGVFVAVGDVDGAGDPEVITGAGPGGAPRVSVLRATGTPAMPDFLAYADAYTGGVRVAACDLDGDGRAEVITATGPGGGPHVRVWQVGGGTPVEILGFFAYDPGVTSGLFVACGDVDGDGEAEIVTAPDLGAGPHVRVWRLGGGAPSEVLGFFAYDPGFTGGVRIAMGDADGDGRADLITAAGPGGGPHVRAWRLGGVPSEIRGFFAYDPGFTGGIFVAAADLDGHPGAEIVTGAGGAPHVRVFTPELTELTGFFAYDPAFGGGVHVAAGR
jgi:hypothetical protein